MCPRLCWRGAPVLAIKPLVSAACPIWAAWFRAYHRALWRYITRLLGRGRAAASAVHGCVVGLQYLFRGDWRGYTTGMGGGWWEDGGGECNRLFLYWCGKPFISCTFLVFPKRTALRSLKWARILSRLAHDVSRGLSVVASKPHAHAQSGWHAARAPRAATLRPRRQ